MVKTFRKAARKAQSKARRYVKQNIAYRYGGKRGGLRRLVSDVMLLKSFVNAEKKNISLNSGTAPVGQTDGATGDGAYFADITPAPPQGNGESQRSGDSIKLTTGVLALQLKQQPNTQHATKFICEIFQVLGTPQSLTTAFTQLYKPNPWITGADIRDYSSLPNQDFRQQYRCIFKRNLFVPADTGVSGQTRHITYKFPIKFGKFGQHIKYDDNTTTVASGQIIMVVRADSGNSNSSVTSTLGNVISQGPWSACVMNRNMEYYYFDN